MTAVPTWNVRVERAKIRGLGLRTDLITAWSVGRHPEVGHEICSLVYLAKVLEHAIVQCRTAFRIMSHVRQSLFCVMCSSRAPYSARDHQQPERINLKAVLTAHDPSSMYNVIISGTLRSQSP